MCPLGRRQLAADDVEQRGFSGAVRTDDGVACARLHRQRHIVYGLEPAEMSRHVLELKTRHGHRAISHTAARADSSAGSYFQNCETRGNVSMTVFCSSPFTRSTRRM